jgi:hypothetical protein
LIDIEKYKRPQFLTILKDNKFKGKTMYDTSYYNRKRKVKIVNAADDFIRERKNSTNNVKRLHI